MRMRVVERIAPPVAATRNTPRMRTALTKVWQRRDVRVALLATLALRIGTSAFAAFVVYALHGAFVSVTTYMNLHGAQRGIQIVAAPTSDWQQYVFSPWLRWDSNFYLDIAAHGYGAPGSSAFLPLYPLLIRIAGFVLAGSLVAAALVLSTCTTFAALLLLYRLALRLTGSSAVATGTIAAACLLPIAFFFVAPYTESLFLALSLGTVLAALDGRWGRAALLAALASLTRQQGVLLAALALPQLWHLSRMFWQSNEPLALRVGAAWRRARAPLLLASAPLLAYAAWLACLALVLRQPAPWQIVTSLPAWNQHYTLPGAGLLADLRLMWQAPGTYFLPALSLPLDIAAAVLGAVGLIALARRLPPALTLYLIACWCIALVKVMPNGSTESAARYLLALLPLCILPGGWLAGEHRRWRLVYVSLSLCLACFCFAEWVMWGWIS